MGSNRDGGDHTLEKGITYETNALVWLYSDIDERQFPFDELYLVASKRSVGKKIEFKGKEYTVIGMQDAVDLKPQIAIFSAGGSTSLEWAPKFADAGSDFISVHIECYGQRRGHCRKIGEFPKEVAATRPTCTG